MAQKHVKPSGDTSTAPPEATAEDRAELCICLQSRQKIDGNPYPVGHQIGMVELAPGISAESFRRLIQAGVAS